FPIFWKPLEVFKDRGDASFPKKRDGILGIFVEIGIEDALIHEVRLTFDVEEHPTEIVQPKYGESVGKASDRFFDGLPVCADRLLAPGFDLRDDCKSITSGSLGEDRAISPLLHFVLEESLFWDRHRRRFGPTLL